MGKMESDGGLLLNLGSIFATLIISSAAGITIFYRLKLRRSPVNANCWFCNKSTKIHPSELTWWQCSNCEQYNGFTKDGDYACDIPEQSGEPLSRCFAKPGPKDGTTGSRNGEERGLCETCNRNQEMKLRELQKFEPKGFFEDGTGHFRRRLEAKYPLCDDCKILVKNVLAEQSLWLTRYKMLFYRDKSSRAVVRNTARFDRAIGTMLTMLTSAVIYYPDYGLLPFLGAFLQSTGFVVHGARKLRSSLDALLTLLWISIVVVRRSREDASLWNLCPSDEWPSLKNLAEHHTPTLLTLLIGIANITRWRCNGNPQYVASLKKLYSPKGSRRGGDGGNDGASASKLTDGFAPHSESNERMSDESPRYFRNDSSSSNDAGISLTNTWARIPRTVFREQQRIVPAASLSKIRKYDEAPTNARPPERAVNRGPASRSPEHYHEYSFDDSLSTLETLTLDGGGEIRRKGETANSGKVPSIFRRRVYGSTSPDLFNRAYRPSGRLILAPPKFKSFAQTSWVAGGYWQVDGDAPPSLSRSSSQSSGFGSAGSNFGPSRETSLVKETTEKCSLITGETTFLSRWPSRAGSLANATTRRCQRHRDEQPPPNCCQSRVSPLHRESRVPTPRDDTRAAHPLSPTSLPAAYSNAQNNNTLCLMMLLGGSLIFNIAVFFTIILR